MAEKKRAPAPDKTRNGTPRKRPPRVGEGRPTDYKPEYCKTILPLFAEGMSMVEVAVNLGVTRETLYEWGRAHSEFSDALTRGRELSQAWWEKMGRENLIAKTFNDKLWAKNVSCRFRNDWTDKQDIEHSGSVGVKIVDDIK